MPLNERKLKSSSYEVIKEYKCVPCCEVFERKETLIEHTVGPRFRSHLGHRKHGS